MTENPQQPHKSKQEVQREQRKELARELRKAHFDLGFQEGFDDETRYREFYKWYDLEQAEKTKQEMLKLRNDLRSTHYILGTDDPNKLFVSTAAQSFIKPVNPQVSQLSVETKNDLRSHHFNLGHYNDKVLSDYKLNYDQKQIDPETLKDRKEQINFLRKHNHDFGDKNNYHSSMYNENFNKSYDPQFLKQGKSKEEIMQQIVDLRKTNLVMGNNNPQFTSEAMSEFNNKPQAHRTQVDLGLKKSHFKLGEDPNLYETTTAKTYQGKQMFQHDPEKIKALSKDLRAEHFKLGHDVQNYTSEAAAKFKEFDKNQLTKQPDMSYLYRSHFNLEGFGGSNPVQHYVSNYKQNFEPKTAQKSEATRNDRADRGSHIVFGSDKIDDQFKSEAQKNFVNFGRQAPSALEKEVQADLRRHHYQFGTDQPEMISEMKKTFNDKTKESSQSKLDPNLIKDLRTNHFEYGTMGNEYTTTMQDIGKYQCQPSRLDPELAKDLRSHHFRPGDLEKYYDTTYRLAFIDFKAV
ncbi:hypothetical protein ABPG74_000894 [Tetrahymena malaccensis]